MPIRMEDASQIATNAGVQEFLSLANHPLKFRGFLLSKLPSAFFAGVRIVNATESSCAVQIPYSWFSRNPFRSTYFACMAMAAEMSTGVLSMAHTYKKRPAVSLLVTAMEANFIKKASQLTIFTCNEGEALAAAIERSVETGEGQLVKVKSTGLDPQGQIIAEFHITWSFKQKKS